MALLIIPGVPVAALDALRLQMPGVLFACINSNYGSQVTVNTSESNSSDKKFIEETGLFFCDPKFFKVFKYKWLAGNAGVLNEPNTVVLTKKNCGKIFWQLAACY